MSINPITVDRLKTFVLVGHSRADGWGQLDPFLTQHTDFAPISGIDVRTDPANCYWKNIYVASSPQPFPGALHAPVAANVGDVAWLELTVANVKTNGDAHPHAHPHNYPNNRGSCYPRYMYNAWVVSGFDGFHYDYGAVGKFLGTLIGLEIPFSHYWRNFWQSQVGLVKMAFSSTLFLPSETGPADPSAWLDPNLGVIFNTPASAQVGPLLVPSSVDTSLGMFYAWWSPATQWDWSPSTDRIYQLWLDKMEGAAAALPAGTKLDVQLIIPWFGDNDALTRSRATLENSFKASFVELIAKMRATIADNDWSTLPADQIPVVCPTIGPGYAGPSLSVDFNPVTFCNDVLAEMASDDPYMRVVDGSEWNQLSDEPEAPPVGMGTGATHESHNGYITAAGDIFEAWNDIRVKTFDALSPKDRVTLGEVMTSVRRRFDRGGVQSDIRDDVLIEMINWATFQVINHVGDSAWWQNRRTQMVLEFDSTGVASLPEHVARALRIEDPDNPAAKVQFDQIGFGNGGRCQIMLKDESVGMYSNGTFRVQHIGWPVPLTKAEQIVPIPRQIIEWVVVETCKRLASGSTDAAKMGMIAGEAAEVMQRCMRTVGAQQRASNDAISYDRPRVQLRY